MRIIFINHRYAPFLGGSERNVQEFAERLVGDGHDVRVVTSDAFDLEYFWDRRRKRVDAPTHERLNGVDVERVAVCHLPGAPIVFQVGRRLLGELSRLPVPAPAFAAFSRRQPWLPELEDAIRRGPPADLIVGTNVGLEGLAITGQRVAGATGARFTVMPFIHLGREGDRVARRYVTMPHQRRLLLQSDSVIAMTATEADFIASLGVPRDHIVVSGAGASPSAVAGGSGEAIRRRVGINGGLVVALGALAPDKGTIDLVRAVAKLRGLGVQVDLVLAGPALRSFEGWYTASDASERIGTHLLGVISEEEKRDLLAAADVVALPSRTESFGIVFVEAWANRKPVIAANAGAVPELVIDGENGLLIPFGDVDALAGAIARLLCDRELASRLGNAGHVLATQQYTWSAVYERAKRAFEIALGHSI